MSMLLKSYEPKELALEDWTDEMLTTLPGWGGWQYATNNTFISWEYRISNNYNPLIQVPGVIGDAVIMWSSGWPDGTNVGQESALPLIAHRPYAKVGSYYYVKGDYKETSAYAQHYSVGRFTSLPE